MKELIFIISKKWSKISKRETTPFCPYLYIHGLSPIELVALKKDLHQEGFKFVDGYDYLGAEFNASSIALQLTHSDGIKIKILDTLANLLATVNVITKTRKIYQFHFGKDYLTLTNSSLGHASIQINKLSDIKGII
ncbi:hypothetical protein [Undibacterium pigrum]|uniref:Uncharacterized protein n=1 Tax=Undibacterium pigrum TaxID=401470 RepID=A0A318JIM4_9BURK|nr:hypothetical protein [Undibacterium pigrum]PXX47082.1 hypothetical protein DFR42_101658 [Undibacterium pigrum]